MASVFRRGIAKKIVEIIKDVKCWDNAAEGEATLSSMFKISRFGRDLPQLILPWHKLLNLNPQIETTIEKKFLITALKNQGLPSPEGISDISGSDSEPPGIMFTLDRSLFTKVVLSDICLNIDVIAKKSDIFRDICPQNVIVEYRAPEIGKAFDMGHFRSIIYSNFLANIQAYVGHNVTRTILIQDWGFNCGMLVAGFQQFGSEEQFSRNPSYHLCEVMKASSEKYKTDEVFREMVTTYLLGMKEKNLTIMSQWKRLRDPFKKHLLDIYKNLGINFDETHTDSMYSEEMVAILNELENYKFLTVDRIGTNEEDKLSLEDGTQNEIVSEPHDRVMYSLARSIACTKDYQNKYNFDAMYKVADSSDKGNFQILVKILEALGYDWYRNIHFLRVNNVHYFSSGKYVPAVVPDALQNARINVLRKMESGSLPYPEENMDEIANNIAVASLFVNDMKHRKNRRYMYNWNEAVIGASNSGISLQLCHAALTRIQEETKVKLRFDANTTLLTEPEAFRLVQQLARFDEIIFKAYTHTEPCVILQYLFTLCYLIERAANVLSLNTKGNKHSIVTARYLLFHASQKVLGKGLELLGIKPVERL